MAIKLDQLHLGYNKTKTITILSLFCFLEGRKELYLTPTVGATFLFSDARFFTLSTGSRAAARSLHDMVENGQRGPPERQ